MTQSTVWTPREYQRVGVEKIIENPGFGLFYKPGLGKTATILKAFSILKRQHEDYALVVVAPPFVTKHVWSDECRRWNDFRDLKTHVCHGSGLEDIAPDADVYTCTPHGMERVVKSLGKRRVMLVADESQMFRNADAQRTNALLRCGKSVGRRIIATGTPRPNGLLNLYTQIKFLDGGQRLGSTMGKYRHKYFDYNPYTRVFNPFPGAERAVMGRISDITMVVGDEQCPDLPEKVDVIHYVDLPPDAREYYDDAVGGIFEDDLQVEDALGVLAKLQQIAQGAVYDADHAFKHIHNAKVDAARAIIEEADSPMLVTYKYLFEPIIHGAKWTLEDADLNAWNAGELDYMFMYPQRGANLQGCRPDILFLGPIYDAELYEQCLRRAWRPGGRSIVTAHHIIARNTVDEVILNALAGKIKDQSEFMYQLRAMHK